MRPFFQFILVLLSFVATEVFAAKSHGISRYGELKYPKTFKNFSYVNPDAPKGGVLRFAEMGTFDSLHRTLQGTPPEGIILTVDTMLVRAKDEPFTLYGLIAESVDVASDNAWVIFTLRSEARFHDGTPITADDVIFSYEIQRDKGLPSSRTHYSKVEKAEKISDREVKFTFKKEADGTIDPERPMIMGLMPIHSKEYWDGKDYGAVTLRTPLGSGPYKIGKFEPGRFIEYERVKDYWAENLPVRKGAYNFDTIRFDYYKNANVALEAFKSGAFDVINEADLNRWTNFYTGPAFAEKKILKVEKPHEKPVGIKGFVFNTRRPFFEDIRVRKALSLMFDFEWINKNLFNNGFVRNVSFYDNSPLMAIGKPEGEERALLLSLKDKVTPETLSEDAIMPPIYDGSGRNREAQTKALELLKKAGWLLKDGKLTHEKTGKSFNFEILLTDPHYEKLALSYARSLKQIGITAKIRTIDAAQYEERRNDWDYDMIINYWSATLTPGNEQYLYWTRKAADTPGQRNYPGIRDEAVDVLVDKLAKGTSNEEVTVTAQALDRVLRHGYYIVPLYYSNMDRLAYWDKFGMPTWDPKIGPHFYGWWAKK